LAWNAALFSRICFHETAIHRELISPHQACSQTAIHDLFKQLLEQLRLLKPSMPVLGEGGVMWNLLIETQSREPTPRQMHPQLFHQLALTGDAVEIPDQQNAQ